MFFAFQFLSSVAIVAQEPLRSHQVGAIVISPTRELATQILQLSFRLLFQQLIFLALCSAFACSV